MRVLGTSIGRAAALRALLLALLLPLAGVFAPGAVAAVTAPSDAAPLILVFGDSISAGYGIHVEQGWVALLARKIEQAGYGFQVVNASISGETTAGGLARLPRALDLHRPRWLVLELGGNDGLRGLPLTETRTNLGHMIELAQARHIGVLLLGMRLPPNYGVRYTDGFQALYAELAQQYHVPLVPFLLEKAALNPQLMQSDGLHPTEAAQPLLLDAVWPTLAPLLQAAHSPAGKGSKAPP